MSKQYLTRLNHLFSPGGLGIKLSPTYGDMPRKNFIHSMATDPKVESAFLKALEAVNGMCPKNENNISNDSPMGDLMHTIKYFSQAGELQRGAVFALANAIQASSTFRGLARAKVISQQMKHRLGLQKKVTFKEPLMIHGGETTIGQGSAYVPSQGGQRRQLEKQGNAKLVSNLSVEQGKGMLEPQNVHPDVLMENQSMPKVTSIREAMTDLSSFQPTATEKYSLNMKEAPGDLKRQQYNQRLHDSFPEKIHAQRGIKRTIPQNSESLSDKKIKGAQMLMENRGTGISEAPVTRSLNITVYPTTGQGTGGKTTMGGTPGVQVIQGESPMVIENLHNVPNVINSGDNASQIKTLPRPRDSGPGVTPGPPQTRQVPNTPSKQKPVINYDAKGKPVGGPAGLVKKGDSKEEEAKYRKAIPTQYHWEYDHLVDGGSSPEAAYQSLYDKYSKKDTSLVETGEKQIPWGPIVSTVVGSLLPLGVKAIDKAIENRWPSQPAAAPLGPTPSDQTPPPADNPKNPKQGGGQALGPGALRTQKTLLETGGSTAQRKKQSLMSLGLVWPSETNKKEEEEDSEAKFWREHPWDKEAAAKTERQNETNADVSRRQRDADRLIADRDLYQPYNYDEDEQPQQNSNETNQTSFLETEASTSYRKEDQSRQEKRWRGNRSGRISTGHALVWGPRDLKQMESPTKQNPKRTSALNWVYGAIQQDVQGKLPNTSVGRWDDQKGKLIMWNKEKQDYDPNEPETDYVLIVNPRDGSYNFRANLDNGVNPKNTELIGNAFNKLVDDAEIRNNLSGTYDVRDEVLTEYQSIADKLQEHPEELIKEKRIDSLTPTTLASPTSFQQAKRSKVDKKEPVIPLALGTAPKPGVMTGPIPSTSTSSTTNRPGMIPPSTSSTPSTSEEENDEDEDEKEEKDTKGGATGKSTDAAAAQSAADQAAGNSAALGGQAGPSSLPYTTGSSTHLSYNQDPKNNGVANPWAQSNYEANAAVQRDASGNITSDPLGYMRPGAGGMRPMIPVNENLPNTEPPTNTLRPSLAEGGANIIDLVLKNPTLQGINRLMWLSWNCGQWDSNQEPDNPLNMVGLVESAWRFSGELDMEDVFANQCEDAITKEYADDVHTAYSIPEQVQKDGIAIIQDIIPQPVEPAPSSETDNLFHDIYLPCWADIPEDSPWKQFTAIEGNQIPDSMLNNPNRITGNDWPLLASENSWISTTLE